MLGSIPECEVCGEAGSGKQALEKIRSLNPDLLLLDISMTRPFRRLIATPLITWSSRCAPNG
jgi:DNA-binding NarL/FixJ family response regulator